MRLFIATSFPADVLRELNERVTKLRPRLPSASWVRPESQHVTFAFLGEQQETLVSKIAPELTDALRAVQKFDGTLRGARFFPNPRYARVGWVGLQPEAKFNEVARVVHGVVTKNGIRLDSAEFKPHLTLMRIRDPWPPASIELFTKTLREYQSETFAVEKLTLYSSQLHPNGAIHTPLHEFALA